MNVSDILDRLPNGKGAVVVLSGGMDSTIAMRFAVEKYHADNVYALSFNYGQKQSIELQKAASSTRKLGVKHKILDLKILGEISRGFSANVDPSIAMPSITEILGDPRPKTYVPNRNMIIASIAASFAEVQGVTAVLMGLQTNDEYNYHDTTQSWIHRINEVLSENRIIKIQVVAPFIDISKKEELLLLRDLDQNVDLLQHTITCYNPDNKGRSCGNCPSCSERMAAFKKVKFHDPIEYR